MLAVECMPTAATAHQDTALREEVLLKLHFGKAGITLFHSIFAGRFAFLCLFSALPALQRKSEGPAITYLSFP
jgi:hypothetical protein